MAAHLDLVLQNVAAAPGTGSTINLGAAVNGYLSLAGAGAISGSTYELALIDPNNGTEIGLYTYSSAGPTLTRVSVTRSSNGGNPINASINTLISSSLSAENVDTLDGGAF